MCLGRGRQVGDSVESSLNAMYYPYAAGRAFFDGMQSVRDKQIYSGEGNVFVDLIIVYCTRSTFLNSVEQI